MKKFYILSYFALFISVQSFSQSYIGHSVDNYAGVHGLIYNPSSIVSSRFRTDINLFSASAFAGSDYFALNLSDATSSETDFSFEEDAKRFPNDENNFFFNVDILGPSFMFNLNRKNSIGVITRMRGMFNINQINGKLYESVSDGFDSDEDYDFNSENLTGTVHAWAEIGLSYGRILLNKQKHLLTGGVTIKYLQGAGSIFIDADGLQGNYTAATETLESQGSLNYGATQGFDSDDINFDNLSDGYGLDLGFTYEWHPEREDDDTRYFQDPYKLKVGVSVTDIGSIKYDNAETTSYNMNASVSTSTYQEDVEEFLDNNYNNTQEDQTAEIKLPTAFHLLVDYRLSKKFLISAQTNYSLVGSDKKLSTKIINSITLAPRLETKWFSFFAPISYREHGDFAFGGGLRFGPLSVGSGSVFSNLMSDSKTTDLFFGLKIPVYRK